MDESQRLIWLNNEILPVNEAKINVLSPTSQFGANVFEGIRCYYNEDKKQLFGFRLQEHYERLLESSKLFRIKHNYTIDELKTYMKDVVKANGYKTDIAVRQTIFIDGFGSWFNEEPVGMFIAPIAKSRVAHPLTKGERCCISSWERISDRVLSPRAKVGANYLNSRLAKLEAKDSGYDSALFLNNQGYVAEGTGSCFFMVKNGKLITPALTESILNSITRDTIIKIAREELNMEVEERQVNRTEVYLADEAFFCGSAVEITPIISIDSYILGDRKPGQITNELHKKYLDIVTGRNDKYSMWLTPIYED